MLSFPPKRATTDIEFFSTSKIPRSGASSTSSVVVTTRLTRRPASAIPQRSSTTLNHLVLPSISPTSTHTSSPISSPPCIPQKRQSQSVSLSIASSDLPREVKRLRTAPAKEKPPKRRPVSSSQNSSSGTSGQRTLPPSPEPIYRGSRSRSTSLFPAIENCNQIRERRWCTDEDGTPGPSHLSSEAVVKRLMKSYKSCTSPMSRRPRNTHE